MTTTIRTCVVLLGILACASLLTGCPTLPVIVVSVIPDAATLEVGQTIGLSAESTSATDTSFTWTTSNSEVVELNATTGTEVTITAVGTGEATISATGSASGVVGEAVVSVAVEPGEGEGEGEPPVITPGGKLAPGLNVQVSSVVIPDDLKPVVMFTATDNKGNLIARSEIADVRFMLDYLTPGQNGSTNRYSSYTTAIEDPDGVPSSGDEATQATYDSARLNGLSQNPDGVMVYKFAKAIPAGYNRSLTHQLGGQMTRNYVVNGEVYPANPIFTFRPDGAAVTEVREIVDTATCNECHTRLGLHGGNRREIQLCILCHSPQTTDGNSGNTVDMPVMIHKIHMGEGLPSVQDGHPYQIYGHRNSLHDYSTVVFPQDIRNCTVCHTADEKASQASFYLTTPTQAGCGSCHDRTWFGNPLATPEGYENHPLDFLQIDDSQCQTCHPATGGISPVREAHLTPVQRPEAPGLELEITGVTANPDDGTLAVAFTAKYGNGTPITDILNDPALQRCGFVVAWPASDYQNSMTEGIRNRTAGTMPGALDSPTSDTGAYTYTFDAKLPTGTSDTFGVAMTGRVAFTVDGEEHEQGVKANSLTFFTNDGDKSAPVPRRVPVEQERCNKCHADLRFHGESRAGVDLCVMCHRPNASVTELDSTPEDPEDDSTFTINLKDMLHRFHTGENLESPYPIGDAEDVRFSGQRWKCDICHVPGMETVPLAAEALPTVVGDGETVFDVIQPTRAACNSCHDGLLPTLHAILATSPAPDNVETCEICHGNNAAYAVGLVHHISN